jgi:CheY-like chemotaxis protein
VTADQFIATVKALTELLGVLLWPCVFLFVLYRYREPLSDFFSGLGEVTFKAFGVEASAKRKVAEAAAAVAAAVASKPADGAQPAAVLEEARAAAGAVANAATPQALRRLGEATVLWVDDHPDNNRYEREALESLGLRFVFSTSTDDALARTLQRSFDAVISDMKRPGDQAAGFTLLDALRKRGDQTPFIIYGYSKSPERVAEARSRGAVGLTNRPEELIAMVLKALGRGVRR